MSKGPIAWFAGNSVAANLLMLLIVIGGLTTLPGIKREVFPEISTDVIVISMMYLGASPEEVEEAICVRIEEAIQGIDGIKRITSTATEGVAGITVELLQGANPREVLDDVKARVDAIDTFPDDAEEPVSQEILIKRQVINIAVSGDVGERALKEVGERVRDEILAVEGITQASLASARPYEISIEVSEPALRRHGITFDDVARAVRRSSLDLPGGSVKTQGGEILFRTKGQAYRGREFEEFVLLTRLDGTRLLLRDVAHVRDGFADSDELSRFDGERTVLVQVFRTGDESALEISAKVREYVKDAQAWMPEGVTLTTWADQSRILQSRLELLQRSAMWGLLLVYIVLTLFLRVRLSFWVTLGIPISFLGALWLMPGLDASFNMISLFAFILVLGIVVDDAIIVGESIFSRQQAGLEGAEASIEGARGVVRPVVFAVLTSIAAFIPMLVIPGVMGKVFRVIPLIVIPTLLFSLVESLFVLPAHLSHFKKEKETRVRRGLFKLWHMFDKGVADALEVFIDRVYRPSLEFALRWRYFTIAWAAATLIVTVGLVGGGYVRWIFFPEAEADNIVAFVTMPPGTPVEVTSDAVRRLEESAEQVRSEVEGEGGGRAFRHILASVGVQPYRLMQHRGPASDAPIYVGSNLGEVNIELVPSEERTISSEELGNRWRELTGAIPDAVELSFSTAIFSAGEAINIQLTSASIDDLRAAADRLKEKLAKKEAVFEISDSFREGKQEVKLQILPEAEALGLSLSDLARQVRQGFYGEEAQRVQRGRDDVKVMIRYPEDDRESLGDLENMRIRTPDGGEVPFSSVAVAEIGQGYASIRRADRRRAINVTADVDEKQQPAGEIVAELERDFLPGLIGSYPGMAYTLEGAEREQQETMQGIGRSYILLVLPLIYVLMAIPFRSYIQPLIVMSAIPFGLVGAVWGHVIMGLDLSIVSMFGLVALTGVVVNDSLVLVDYINRRRGEGDSAEESARKAGMVRFRPILLTSLTTFAGVAPLLIERSVQAAILIPMAVSLGFGVIFSTFITLVMVPSSYLILEDFRRGWGWVVALYTGPTEEESTVSDPAPGGS